MVKKDTVLASQYQTLKANYVNGVSNYITYILVHTHKCMNLHTHIHVCMDVLKYMYLYILLKYIVIYLSYINLSIIHIIKHIVTMGLRSPTLNALAPSRLAA